MVKSSLQDSRSTSARDCFEPVAKLFFFREATREWQRSRKTTRSAFRASLYPQRTISRSLLGPDEFCRDKRRWVQTTCNAHCERFRSSVCCLLKGWQGRRSEAAGREKLKVCEFSKVSPRSGGGKWVAQSLATRRPVSQRGRSDGTRINLIFSSGSTYESEKNVIIVVLSHLPDCLPMQRDAWRYPRNFSKPSRSSCSSLETRKTCPICRDTFDKCSSAEHLPWLSAKQNVYVIIYRPFFLTRRNYGIYIFLFISLCWDC